MNAKKQPQYSWLSYRQSQVVGFLLSARALGLIFYTLTLYVSTFFLFNQEESLRSFVFDYKVHGIILCSVLSIAAGGLINQFYDREKDRLTRPFRSYLQSFIKQKYILYSYLSLNVLSLGMAYLLSSRIFIFFLIYQFLIWFYSHKLSRWVVVNHGVYVSLSLYPFFGLLVYYQYFSYKLFWMAVFLFLTLLMIDILKDYTTRRADFLFGYQTLPIVFGSKVTRIVLFFLMMMNAGAAGVVVTYVRHSYFLKYYFMASIAVFVLMGIKLLFSKPIKVVLLINWLKIWIFIGVGCMFLNGVYERF